jgi:hypothetical protein
VAVEVDLEITVYLGPEHTDKTAGPEVAGWVRLVLPWGVSVIPAKEIQVLLVLHLLQTEAEVAQGPQVYYMMQVQPHIPVEMDCNQVFLVPWFTEQVEVGMGAAQAAHLLV